MNGYRFQRITTLYSTYLEQFYANTHANRADTYEEQYHELVADLFGWADFWGVALGKHGYTVSEVIANARPLQYSWAHMYGLVPSEDSWLFEIVQAQIAHFRPEILFIDDYLTFPRRFIEDLRKDVPSIRMIIGWCGAPFNRDIPFDAYDLVLTNVPEHLEYFRKNRLKSELMTHAFDPRVLSQISAAPKKDIPFSFVGSVITGNQFHRRREALLTELAERSDIQIFSDVSAPSLRTKASKAIRTLQRRIFGTGPDPVPCVSAEILRRAHAPVFGRAMFETLQRSSITLNNHIDISPRSASNMRLFEATGVGTCLLTDWKENLSSLFDVDREVVTYRSTEECLERMHYLQNNPDVCSAIAQAGQKRTLRDHTFAHRAQRFDEIIQAHLHP